MAAESGFLGEWSGEPVDRPKTAARTSKTDLDGSGTRSAARTVAPDMLAVLMTLRHGG